MIITEEFVQSVRPKRLSQDDKYSVKMYRYLKEKIGKDLSVFHGTKNASFLRDFISYSTTQDKNLSESISDRRNLPVNFLGEVFKRGNKTDDYSAAPNESIIKDVVEDKDWFLKYLKIGKCTYLSCSEFKYVNNTRKCIYCGKWQHKKIKKYVSIDRIVCWE